MTSALRFAVIGMPIAHSKSPFMHAAAFRALGLPHVYDAVETGSDELHARVDSLRRGTFAGLNVTVPHKERVLAYVDEVDPSARSIGAANTLVRSPATGRVVAHNTDVVALTSEIARLAGEAPRFQSTSIVLGSGGAARAAVAALMRRSYGKIEIRARTAKELDIGGLRPRTQPLVAPPAEDARLACIIQASSCGMEGAAPGELVADAVAWSSVPRSAVAIDLVYAPPDTPFLARARARGLVADDGLRILALQGGEALRLWLGVAPPIDAMRAALALG